MNIQKIRRKIKRTDNSFLKIYWYEITVIFLITFGLFLLVDDIKIKEIIIQKGKLIINGIINVIISILIFLKSWIINIKVSDIIGLFLVMIAGLMVSLRFRQRFIFKYEHIYECPECESSLQRIHSTLKHRLIHLIMRLKVKNYKCSKCSYIGFRISKLRK